ncbi:Sec-independent protein translocase protein TatB [Corynebacterium sp. UBA2622]|uniref:Sec-independent protein translocase protein TatB n=1 Tax=Corynebacterium sp. UBA2622 TaxID=1946393 RepID=UPI0025BBCB50|nr:Sec-independent protein translocase protein TatB [Corynebacterium sp. UBA2622]
MFSNIGWGEIFFILLIGLIVIGPERLPGVVADVRAGIYAARKAINNAKKELELDAGFEEFEEFRKPLNAVTEYAALGPRRAVAKVLFDDPDDRPGAPARNPDEPDPRAPSRPSGPRPAPGKPAGPGSTRVDIGGAQDNPRPGRGEAGSGGFSWADIT